MSTDPLARRLLRDETILWSGRPRQGVMLTKRDFLIIPLSLLWGGFAIWWEASVLTMNAPASMALFGIPFVLAGLFLVFGRFLFDAWLRGKIHYALTDRRALILREGRFGAFKALRLTLLQDVTLIEGSGHRGTIRFSSDTNAFAYAYGWGIWVPALDPTPQFLQISEAGQVFTMTQERVQSSRSEIGS